MGKVAHPAFCVRGVAGYQVLTASMDPCQSVSCGSFGTCFKGLCECKQGYTGTTCEVAPIPVDAVYGPWSEFSPCSMSCGGGVQSATRQCTPPAYGGAACVANSTVQTRACNESPCLVVINGGFSAWTEWSTCSQTCPGDKAGYFLGVQTRSRSCTNPAPSATGSPCVGDSLQSGMLHY